GGGHPSPLLFTGLSPTDGVQTLSRTGPPIGITNEVAFRNHKIGIPLPGRLLLYSDGIVEVRNPNGTMADQGALTAFAAQPGQADTLLDRLLDRARSNT